MCDPPRLRAHTGCPRARPGNGSRGHARGRTCDRRVRSGRRSRPRQAGANGRNRRPPRRHRHCHVRQSAHRGSRKDSRRRGSGHEGQAALPHGGPPRGDRASARGRPPRRHDPARGQGARDLSSRRDHQRTVRRARSGPGLRGGVMALHAWTSDEVAVALGVSSPAKLQFKTVATDTRHPIPDSLFVALRGENFDAHNFLAQAKAQGAAAAVVRRGTPAVDGLPYFEVDDTLTALGQLARARRRMLPEGTPVVAITGSSGKTSAKEMIRATLGARYRVHSTIGNFNNLVGVPLTILSAPEDTEALVVEAGASIPGEIAKLRDIIEPTIAVITNISHAHVEGFGSLERVMAEKLSLLDGVPVAILGSGPDAMWPEARRRTQVIPAALPGKSSDDALLDRYLDKNGHPRLALDSGVRVTLPALGIHQLENARIALAVAQRAGVEHDAAVQALAGLQLPEGRGDVREIGNLVVIDDTYNANPASMRRAVQTGDWLARRQRRPFVVVVGTMLELGPQSARLHAEAARDIAQRKPALVAAVGTFARAFESPREAPGGRLITAADADALGPKLKSPARGNGIVMLKASPGDALGT